MKNIIFLMTLIMLSSSAKADLTTSQKVKCATEALSKVLGTDFDIIADSIELKKTGAEKFNVVAKAINVAGNFEADQNHVGFIAKFRDNRAYEQWWPRLYEGTIVMQTEKDVQRPLRQNNNTTIRLKELTSSQVFKCTLTVTQFTGNADTNRNIELRDLQLRLLGD